MSARSRRPAVERVEQIECNEEVLDVPTSNPLFRLLCLTERIFTTALSLHLGDQFQNAPRRRTVHRFLVVQIPFLDRSAVGVDVHVSRRVIAFPGDEDVPAPSCLPTGLRCHRSR